jgi:hypothetical protein
MDLTDGKQGVGYNGFVSFLPTRLSHIFFAAVTTAYILVAIRFEGDLMNEHPEYLVYRNQVPMLLPRLTRLGSPVKSSRRRPPSPELCQQSDRLAPSCTLLDHECGSCRRLRTPIFSAHLPATTERVKTNFLRGLRAKRSFFFAFH